jgi:hypothetical protein
MARHRMPVKSSKQIPRGQVGGQVGGHQVWYFGDAKMLKNYFMSGHCQMVGPFVNTYDFSGAIGQWPGRMARH